MATAPQNVTLVRVHSGSVTNLQKELTIIAETLLFTLNTSRQTDISSEKITASRSHKKVIQIQKGPTKLSVLKSNFSHKE
jgi:hypothetical protein